MQENSSINLQLFYPEDIKIQSAVLNEDVVHIMAKSTTHNSRCPYCGCESSDYHSTYKRTIQDLPILGKRTILNLKVHKYYCNNKECEKKEFCETLDNFCDSQRRMTTRLEHFITLLALNTSCEGAANVCKEMGIKTNGDSIIRLLKIKYDKMEKPKAGTSIGVDDWAYAKGQTYGTIIVDEKTHKPLDLLEGRDGSELKKWLEGNKHIKIITRDRASAFAAAISEVLPNCIQVADRYHLHENMLKMIKDIFAQEIPSKIKIEINEEIKHEDVETESKKKRNTRRNHNNKL